MQRDPLGYVDGMSVYGYYAGMWGGVNPSGLQLIYPIITGFPGLPGYGGSNNGPATLNPDGTVTHPPVSPRPPHGPREPGIPLPTHPNGRNHPSNCIHLAAGGNCNSTPTPEDENSALIELFISRGCRKISCDAKNCDEDERNASLYQVMDEDGRVSDDRPFHAVGEETPGGRWVGKFGGSDVYDLDGLTGQGQVRELYPQHNIFGLLETCFCCPECPENE